MTKDGGQDSNTSEDGWDTPPSEVPPGLSGLSFSALSALSSTPHAGAKPPDYVGPPGAEAAVALVAEIEREAELAAVAALGKQVALLMREPFQKLLVDVIRGAPTVENIQAYAARFPDKWGQLAAIMARLAGFNDEVTVKHRFEDVRTLSDAELLAELSVSPQPSDVGIVGRFGQGPIEEAVVVAPAPETAPASAPRGEPRENVDGQG